jgi:hypothetical protein
MDKSLKRKNIIVIVFEILVIALGVGVITFAAARIINTRTTTLLTVGKYNVEYLGSLEVTADDLEPISDSMIGIDTHDNVARVEFSLRGVKENKADDLIYDVMLTDMNIDCSLLNKYTKWNLYKNGALLSHGSFDPSWDGDVLGDNMRLTNIQEDLPGYTDEYDNYVLLFWISETCDDLTTCELIDQSAIIDSTMSMKAFIALYTGEKTAYERVGSNDTTCANKPELFNSMVPVTYKNGTWVVADEKNSNNDYLWYNYDNANWANAVVIKSGNYSEVGTVINDDDVLAYYTWIPRYRYKLWNATEEVTDSYNAYDEGINIVFESGLSGKKADEIKNDIYITHPAFGDDLRGIWVSKYELNNKEGEYTALPGLTAYTGGTLESYKSLMTGLSETYNLGENANTHMLTNLEWGSVAYLSHSKYGVCKGDGCSTISTNGTYVAGSDKQDTTTRNVYGIYDMSGGAGEYIDGYSNLGTATSEVKLPNDDTWYKGHGLLSDRDYIIRGGIDRGMYYFGDISMGYVETGSRSAITSK